MVINRDLSWSELSKLPVYSKFGTNSMRTKNLVPPIKKIFKVSPIKDIDLKAISKSIISNKFIGYGIEGSSTDLYRQQISKQSKQCFNLFWKYVNSGYYQKFINDLKRKYNEDEIIKINNQIRNIYILQLQKDIPQLGKIYLYPDNSTLFVENEHILKQYENKYNRLMVGNHGIYLEYTEDINKCIFVKKHLQYDEYIKNNKKLYHQHSTVNYADYKINKWYVDIYDLFNINKPDYNNTDVTNCGFYNPDDVVFVSINGKCGDLKLREQLQNKTIEEVLIAIENGASIVTDNKKYIDESNYNEGENKLKDILESKGISYMNIKVNNHIIGLWNSAHKHFGNPFTHSEDIYKNNDSLILCTNIKTAVDNYTNWLSGKIIISNKKYTRNEIEKDTKNMYIFTDNTMRTSSPKSIIENVDKDSWYYKKYKNKTTFCINYGTNSNPTSAVMRGLNNSFPISTMYKYGKNWTDETVDLFKETIDDEINDIKQQLNKFNNLIIGNYKIGQGGLFAKLPMKHQLYLDNKLREIGIDNNGEKPTYINNEQREWILFQIKMKKLNNKKLLYMKEKGNYYSHANALVDFISKKENKYFNLMELFKK